MKYLFSILIVLLLFSCNRRRHPENDEILARVYDSYLFSSELENVIPAGINVKDSLMLAKNYINNWVRQNLVVYQAEHNLTEEQKDFEKQLESYRNSLITYQYETQLILQKLDTNISEIEIEAYYEQNRQNFDLRDNILICNFIALNPDTTDVELFGRLLQSDQISDIDTLRLLCTQQAASCYLNREKWVLFSDLTREIPISTYDEESFIRNNTFVKIKENYFVYLIRILDFRISGTESPIGFERDNIRRIILNKRKTTLIKTMENEIFNGALEKNEIEIF
jgi:hypothetical protein